MSSVDYSGQTIDDRYSILRLLGEGGMGAVYLGEHIVLGRQVAVKFLHGEYAAREEVIKRFYREARAAAAIKHNNIIDVLDVGLSSSGEPYLVMEYLEGESLSGMLKRIGPIDVAAACGIMEPTLIALQIAHDNGIVHRDLKPENIFLQHIPGGAPEVKLIDFGISKFEKDIDQTKLTRTGALLGTPAYMSPEQARGEAGVNHRTDLYSIGVILYEMLTGELPHTANNYNTLIVSLLTEDPRPPSEAYAGFQAEAEDVLMKSLSKDPIDRYQSAGDMLDAFRRLAGYGQRRERLTHFASSITARNVAAGDLGDALSADEGNSDTILQLSKGESGTLEGWTRTTGKLVQSRRVFVLGLIGFAIVAAAGIAAHFWEPAQAVVQEEVTSEVAIPSAEPEKAVLPQDKGVVITIEGAPKEAKVFYDNSPVSQNPFRVKQGQTIIPLRVETPGHEPFRLSLTPSEDKVIKVTLTKSPPDRHSDRKKAPSGDGSGKPTKKAAPPEDKRFIKGGRETEIAGDFE
ncbi:MAG: serine/threonine protein kinase [Deltaproteobacteria bacterium]|nr:serine/threonine protein kinase [Deltaproteobacteria bacterium]